MQQSSVALRATLNRADAAIGVAASFFTLTLGGAIFVTVGQSVFTSRLVAGLRETVGQGAGAGAGGIDAAAVVNAGATNLRDIVPAELLPQVLEAYSKAVTSVFYICVAMSLASLVGSLAMEWTPIKKPSQEKKTRDEEEGENVEEENA